MKLKYLQFLAVLLWGIETDLLLFALPMGIILEARHYLNRRWALTRQDFYRVADLTSLALAGVIVFLFLNRAEYHFVISLVQWLPIVLFPLVVVLAYSTTERMPLDVLFYSLRRQREPVTQSWDMNYLFFGMCLVSAGTNTKSASYYMALASLLVLLSLYRLGSPRYRRNEAILLACIVFLAASLTQQGFRGAHLALQEKTRQWLAAWVRARTNPLKTTSAIGAVGQLKLSDAIVFRVKPLEGDAPRLLQEATYDASTGNNWMVLNPQFREVPHADDFRWRIGEHRDVESTAKIYLEFDREADIVPVPSNLTQITDLPALDIRQSRFGTIQALGLVPSPGFQVSYGPGSSINSPPDPGGSDRLVPREYEDVLQSLLSRSAVPDDRPVLKVSDVFAEFAYSIYQDVRPGDDPLMRFLTESRAGHCEYFATATVLLLRQLGVDARYAVGYSVQEYDDMLDMYVVRRRHAHAWAIAWLDGAWQVVDTTPQVWPEAEAAESSLMRPIWDLLGNASFMFQLWWNEQELEDYELELYLLGAILTLILIWRIATSEQVVVGNRDEDSEDRDTTKPGIRSPLFRIEAHLDAAGLSRKPGELFATWFRRIGHEDLLPLVAIHNRLRFDPRGVDEEQLAGFADRVDHWLARKD